MDTPPGERRNRLTRRRLMLAGGTSAGAIALGGLGLASVPDVADARQFDSTPPPPPLPEAAPPSGETVDDVAARLNYDAEAIFAFVRDEIHYESYAGVLRGAKGTLWARAGNAADQAVLLGALFAAASIPYRFATGALDPARAEALAARLALTRDEAYLAYYEATIAASRHSLGGGELPDVDAAAPEALAGFDASGQAAIDLARASLDAAQATIADALASGGVTLPPPGQPRLSDFELNQHSWIQVADGATWIDYNPGLPEGTAASEPLTPLETLETLPTDWYHRIKIAVAADDYETGALSRRELVAFTTTSDLVVDVPIAISMAAPDDLSNLGLTLTELFTGQKSIFPSIYADGASFDSQQPLVFATGEATTSDPFGDGGEGVTEGETVAVFLVVEITSPGDAPVVVERTLLDRVAAEDRTSGVIAPANVAPVVLVANSIGEETLEAFNVLPVIHVDVARMPTVNAIARFTNDTVYGGLGLLGPTLAEFRDVLGEQEETRHGYWSYPSAPNVTVFHVSLPGEGDTGSLASIAVDLLHRRRTSLPLADVEASGIVHPLVLSGILDAVAERTLLAPETRGDLAESSPYATGSSVPGIFEAAAEDGIDVRLLTSTADLDGFDVDPASLAYLTAALEGSQLVIVPGSPVELNGESMLGWWIIDPETGRTRDQMQNGMAHASASFPVRPMSSLAQTGEYSFLTRAILWVASNGRGFICMGIGIAAGVLWAAALIRGLNGGSTGRSAAAGGLASAGGVAGALVAC